MRERITNDGTLLQDKLAAALKEYCEYNLGFYHRFPDTKSAGGNFLKAQPGDFFLLVPGASILIECKSTKASATLLSLAWHGTVGKRQIAKHRLWQRSGHPSAYLFGDLQSNTVEWHIGSHVVSKVNRPVVSVPISELPKSIHQVVDIIKRES